MRVIAGPHCASSVQSPWWPLPTPSHLESVWRPPAAATLLSSLNLSVEITMTFNLIKVDLTLPRTTKVTKIQKKPTAHPSQHSPLGILPRFAATMLDRDATICLFPFLAGRPSALSPFHEGRDLQRQRTARGLLDERADPVRLRGVTVD